MGIVDNIKDVVSIVQKADNIELYQKVLDLQSDAIDMVEQLKQNDEIISKLKKALEVKGKLLCKDSAYYLTDEKDEIIDGPFCTKCFDVDHTTCRLVRKKTTTGRDSVQCPNCKVAFPSYGIAEYLSRH